LNLNFSQMITVHSPDLPKLIELIQEWDLSHASGDITGYMGSRVLADRENPSRYVVIVDFGVVDPDVSAAVEAERSNARPETLALAAAVRAIIDGPPQYHNYDEVFRTDM
jgi:hypothetical protein